MRRRSAQLRGMVAGASGASGGNGTASRQGSQPRPPAAPAPTDDPTHAADATHAQYWECINAAHVCSAPLGIVVGEAACETVIEETSRHYDMFDDMWIETSGEDGEVVYTRRDAPWSVRDPNPTDVAWTRALSISNDGVYSRSEVLSMDEKEKPRLDLGAPRCTHALDCVVNDAHEMSKFLSSPTTNLSGMRDWNTEFQELLEGLMYAADEELRTDVRSQLDVLVEDFVKSAESSVATIVKELFTASSDRSIHAIGAPGQGTYFHDGIYFRMCIDTSAGLYGGDPNAMKAGGHLHKANTALMKVSPFHFLYVPLEAVITLQGYRVVAMSVPPLPSSSLVAGSIDGGKTNSKAPGVVDALLRSCAAELNLKLHDVGNRVHTGLPVDMQVHGAKDGRLYLFNTWRLFPASLPRVRYPHYRPSTQGLTWRVRPEVLQQCDVQLSSDAFLRGASTPEDNVDVALMEQWIRDTGIPLAAATLSFHEGLSFGVPGDRVCTSCNADLASSIGFHTCWHPTMCCVVCPECYMGIMKTAVVDNEPEHAQAKATASVKCGAPVRALNGFVMVPDVTTQLHEVGLNLRYLCYVHAGIRPSAVMCTAHYLEIEMIARSVKVILLSKLRTSRGPEEIRETVQRVLSGLLHADGDQAVDFWANELGPMIQRKFGVVTPFDTSRLDRFLVYDRVAKLTGVQLTAESARSLVTEAPVICVKEVVPVLKTVVIPALRDVNGEKQTRAKELVAQLRAFWNIRFDATQARDEDRLPQYLK
eukprot:PhM_4_TR17218/c0_g2_i1/m.88805